MATPYSDLPDPGRSLRSAVWTVQDTPFAGFGRPGDLDVPPKPQL